MPNIFETWKVRRKCILTFSCFYHLRGSETILEQKGRLIFKNWLRVTLMTLMKRSKRKLLLKCLYEMQLLEFAFDPKSHESFYLIKLTEEEKEKTEDVEDGFDHLIKKEMKHLEGLFLKRKFDPDNFYTTSKKPKSTFFFM